MSEDEADEEAGDEVAAEDGGSLLRHIAPATWLALGVAVVVTIGLGIAPDPVIDWAGEAIPQLVADVPTEAPVP